jgi:hypothetical protein
MSIHNEVLALIVNDIKSKIQENNLLTTQIDDALQAIVNGKQSRKTSAAKKTSSKREKSNKVEGFKLFYSECPNYPGFEDVLDKKGNPLKQLMRLSKVWHNILTPEEREKYISRVSTTNTP